MMHSDKAQTVSPQKEVQGTDTSWDWRQGRGLQMRRTQSSKSHVLPAGESDIRKRGAPLGREALRDRIKK